MEVVLPEWGASAVVFTRIRTARIVAAFTIWPGESLFANAFVASVVIFALSAIFARIPATLVDVVVAVRPVESGLAATTVRVAVGDALAIVTRIPGTPIDFRTMFAFPSDRADTRVVGKREQGASSAILARTVVARVHRLRDLAERGPIANGTGALERRGPGRGQLDVARSAILAFLATRCTRVLVLAILANKVRGTVAISVSE